MSTDVTAKTADPSTPAAQPPRVTEREARQVAEAARETGLAQAELRQGAVPRPLPARPDPPAPDLRSPTTSRRGEAFLAKLREFCDDDRRRPDRARVADPRRDLKGLKELGALGMKIDTQVRRPRPHPGLLQQGADAGRLGRTRDRRAALRPPVDRRTAAGEAASAPRSRRRTFLPRCARTDISAFLLTEPDVGSDPARLATTAVPRDGDDYLLDGVKLWTTNGVGRRPAGRHGPGTEVRGHTGGITAFVVEGDTPRASPSRTATRFMGLRGIENGVTRFHQVRVPAANRIGPEGAGLKIALTTLNTGRLSLPAMCAGAGEVVPEDRPRVVRGPRAVGQAGRPARGGRRQDLLHRGHHLRAGGGPRPRPRRWPTRTATTSGSRRRWPSCTAARWAG